MTIGIAAYGKRSGAAVVAAVLGAELLGRGAIGGFAVFAVLDPDGTPRYRTTQDGGISALEIPSAWLDAERAAVISSGPDRPEPLTQFLVAGPGGLVTGHRLPNSRTAGGMPVNEAVSALLERGEPPQQAVDAALAADPEIDAGIIAMTADGRIGFANAARVKRRTDLGQARREGAGCGFALLHNSIFVADGECRTLADILGPLVWQELTGTPAGHAILRLDTPIRIEAAERDRLHIDADGRIVGLESADPRMLSAERVGAVGYLSAEVWQGGRRVGSAVTELIARLAGGTAHPHGSPARRSMMMRRSHVAS
ncbi:hypothetical protein [Nitratireductor sp. ZSWI3]|uniref:DUF6963 family protein n=1 Tax=Nitratireductor sp. ZSWI3 TaxID=2966359 RepID=UPI00214F766C|nr:hypothetical protein [Nitratireductor sp. ZSWI3]MCR4266541.1 hypothetical protein [Nitratireductor sp. ZSWI3]